MITIVVLEQSDWHKLIEGRDEKGEVVFRAFQCKIDPDNPAYLAAMYDDYGEQYERDEFLKTHDPNKIDSRRVRHELGDNMVNLGMRANKVPAKIWRL